MTPMRTRMHAADFARLPERSQPTQLVHGEVIVSPSPIDAHQDIVVRLILLLNGLIPGGKLVVAPMDVYLDDANVYQPDVFWVAPTDSRCVNRDGYYYGPPDLIVEVLSPGTAKIDREEKYRVYETQGVREYWIADPHHTVLEVWTHDGTRFVRQGAYNAADRFSSGVLGADVTVAEVFQDK